MKDNLQKETSQSGERIEDINIYIYIGQKEKQEIDLLTKQHKVIVEFLFLEIRQGHSTTGNRK